MRCRAGERPRRLHRRQATKHTPQTPSGQSALSERASRHVAPHSLADGWGMIFVLSSANLAAAGNLDPFYHHPASIFTFGLDDMRTLPDRRVVFGCAPSPGRSSPSPPRAGVEFGYYDNAHDCARRASARTPLLPLNIGPASRAQAIVRCAMAARPIGSRRGAPPRLRALCARSARRSPRRTEQPLHLQDGCCAGGRRESP